MAGEDHQSRIFHLEAIDRENERRMQAAADVPPVTRCPSCRAVEAECERLRAEVAALRKNLDDRKGEYEGVLA